MFVQNLNPEQQKLLVSCSKKLISADGRVDDKEMDLLSVLLDQCHSSIKSEELSPENISEDFNELKGKFADNKEKVSFMLELIGMAWVDEDYDEREKSQIRKACDALQISTDMLRELEDWVNSQLKLSNQAQLWMEV